MHISASFEDGLESRPLAYLGYASRFSVDTKMSDLFAVFLKGYVDMEDIGKGHDIPGCRIRICSTSTLRVCIARVTDCCRRDRSSAFGTLLGSAY